MAVVTLQNVRKVYAGDIEAVKGVSLDIPDGHLCVLVGPSGCGKSTLLRMVAGLETITSGSVAIGGREVNEVEPADRDIAMVFQNYALYPHMSVYDNIAYGLRNRRTPKDEIDRRVQEAARILAIEPFLNRKPRALSGGQRQRVAMGRAIVRKPQVFLFDEPLSNLDAKLRVQMRVEIKKLQRALGVTSIYVTHDQVEAMTLSDKLVVMNAGRVEQVGAPSEVYRRPATRFVATFIGSPPMNLLDGVVEGEGRVRVDGAVLDVSDMRAGLQPGHLVEVGIRPEDLEIVGSASNSVSLPIDFVEELGATQLFYGALGGQPFVVQAGTGVVPADAKSLGLRIAAERIHVFDRESGQRLGRVAETAAA
ncbi:sn-glycerol-3-phosphate import ATP-binding protein UgpC [Alsobacter sp. SYSU M60028]|uniref:Sn-glycerol-3-phosphate import ATP-binding protein UgpC n=1 Tax=Alsobacter ponti TaxID=2962936 RepID=A0ABT1LGJ2_9HYPH|nr:sn-glycerol-3-phosphate import ATP-binding protein UgpC [Alsobacter ponti]MCP8940627.1 sn-glycerol-3-phosphate import ATP-binding protein UgpC [Alsobacter ponti]